MKTKRRMLAVLMAALFLMGTFPGTVFAGDIPMDGDWETIAITSDTLDLSGGSETRPVMNFYDVANTLFGLAYIGQINTSDVAEITYFDLDKDGTNDLVMSYDSVKEATTISATDERSQLLSRTFTLNGIAIDYLKSIGAPGYCEELKIIMPGIGDPGDEDGDFRFTFLSFDPKDMRAENNGSVKVTYHLNADPEEVYLDYMNEYGNWIETSIVQDPAWADVKEVYGEDWKNRAVVFRLHANKDSGYTNAWSQPFTLYFGSAGNRTNPFVDVAKSNPYYKAILWAYYANPQITNGMDYNHFGPNSTVTRGQAVTFLWRSQGCPEPKSTKNPFVDVPKSQYYYKAILWAVEKGITKGTDATHFTPDQTLSTAHIITFLYRMRMPGLDGWYSEAQSWAEDGNGLPLGVNIEVSDTVNCPRGPVVQFLFNMEEVAD
ncbi:MAG: S-layer homology domain-containing protein [Firmicutes bacterium]|nr:S-layer homology domain-containing protein [Bacillota bacterium]